MNGDLILLEFTGHFLPCPKCKGFPKPVRKFWHKCERCGHEYYATIYLNNHAYIHNRFAEFEYFNDFSGENRYELLIDAAPHAARNGGGDD